MKATGAVCACCDLADADIGYGIFCPECWMEVWMDYDPWEIFERRECRNYQAHCYSLSWPWETADPEAFGFTDARTGTYS